jgi:hypothetical protein
MPERQTLQRAQRDKLAGKAPSTQAGEFVREEMHHIREGRHGARSARQAVAIGLSKARRAGVALKPPAQARSAARRRSSASRSAAAQKAVRTKGPAARSLAAKKAARTRVTHGRSRSAGRIRMRSTRGRSATSARVGAAL